MQQLAKTSQLYKRYPYMPRKINLLVIIAASSLAASLFIHLFVTNQQGLIIDGIIKLSASKANIFYGILAIFAILFVLIGLYASIRAFSFRREIIITPTGVTIPRGGMINRGNTVVPYNQICALDIIKQHHWLILRIYTDHDMVGINQSMLPSKKVINEIFDLLNSRVNAVLQ